MLVQDKFSQDDCITIASFAIQALKVGHTSREIEKAIRKVRLTSKKASADPENEALNHAAVNALNERALDELNIVVDHLGRRDDVRAVIFTGTGPTFVAGADIRQLLEDVHTLEEALPLPNNAHLAFGKIEALDKPAIAAINGVGAGGGQAGEDFDDDPMTGDGPPA